MSVAHHNTDVMEETFLAKKILVSIQEPIQIADNQASLSASIGIAISPDDGIDFDTVNQKAELAMYQSKHSGRNNFHYFHSDMSNVNGRQLKIAQVLLDNLI